MARLSFLGLIIITLLIDDKIITYSVGGISWYTQSRFFFKQAPHAGSAPSHFFLRPRHDSQATVALRDLLFDDDSEPNGESCCSGGDTFFGNWSSWLRFDCGGGRNLLEGESILPSERSLRGVISDNWPKIGQIWRGPGLDLQWRYWGLD